MRCLIFSLLVTVIVLPLARADIWIPPSPPQAIERATYQGGRRHVAAFPHRGSRHLRAALHLVRLSHRTGT